MNSKKTLLLGASAIIVFVGLIAGFNYSVDPLCYYCKEIDVNKSSVNRYYQVAQMIVKNPDAEQVLLGSSRGETTSPLWIQSVSGLKTLNLSASGAEVITKKAFLNLALEKTKLKKVIWYADYFELITSNADAKIKNTQVLRKYAADMIANEGFAVKLQEIQKLIDHNTTEASFAALKHSPASSLGQGEGSQVDYSACDQPDFKGKETPESLKNEIDLLYQAYVNGSIKPPQNTEALKRFEATIKDLQARNIAVLIVIPPYHPVFMKRLETEYPGIYEAHIKWIQNIQKLQGPGIEVKNYFNGIPEDNGSPSYWNDGVHFTCKSVIQMLRKTLVGGV
ncbi:hypothetical protein [Bdellovibrio svalbardensis]|uniref:SGNH/GDSL hydrolase family protein n=1 Tax=Bdellovibrio svalbardensis TaxID=2972972 RepID=A0ABT6DK50_9BACT|nr:hypothetical protein [Bdellovibrio svalbardensis]MDG0816575.1 hypothetical protein [Bdellovibrio svalbardensis]